MIYTNLAKSEVPVYHHCFYNMYACMCYRHACAIVLILTKVHKKCEQGPVGRSLSRLALKQIATNEQDFRNWREIDSASKI